MPQPREYILGTHDEEARRLGFQHRLWSDLAHATWKRAGIKPGHKVLDIGCGPGFALMDLAEIVTGDSNHRPGGVVIGVDESQRYIDRVNESAKARGLASEALGLVGDVQNLRQVLTEATDRLKPLGCAGDNAFDLLYARWVLCFLPHPERVINDAAKLLKPGGTLTINDYFNYESLKLAPRSQPFERVVEAVGKSWRSRGGDPDVMARVPAMCREAGLDVEHLAVEQRSARPHESMWMWADTFFRIYVPTLVQHGFLTDAERDAFTAEWVKYSANPDSFWHAPPVYHLVARKV
jgi:SAM-dependent methyltransferase